MSPTRRPDDGNRRPPPIGIRFGRWQARLDLSWQAHLVALTAQLYARADGTGIRPGIEQLMQDTALPKRSVQYALRELEQRDVLLVAYRGGGRGRATEYRLNPAALALFAPETVRGSDLNGARSGRNGAPPAPQEVEEVVEEGGETPTGPVGSRRRRQTPEEAQAVAEQNRLAARASRAGLLLDGRIQPTRDGDEELMRDELERRRQEATA